MSARFYRILLGLNVLNLFVAIAMLIAGLQYAKFISQTPALPDHTAVEQHAAEYIGETYTQELHDSLNETQQATRRVLANSTSLHQSAAKLIRNFGFAWVGIAMICVVLVVRTREGK